MLLYRPWIYSFVHGQLNLTHKLMLFILISKCRQNVAKLVGSAGTISHGQVHNHADCSACAGPAIPHTSSTSLQSPVLHPALRGVSLSG